jgi:hypothetical protein
MDRKQHIIGSIQKEKFIGTSKKELAKKIIPLFFKNFNTHDITT